MGSLKVMELNSNGSSPIIFQNNHGNKGTTIPLHEATECSNNNVKQAIKNLGPYQEYVKLRLLHHQSLKRHAKSGKHSDPSKERDLRELINRAVYV